MKKIYSLFLTFLILALPVAIFAQTNFKSDNIVTLSKDEVINKDYFAAGNSVVLSGTVNGDAYLAGRNINVDGIVNGDLLTAGGNLNISGKVNGNIRAAGGQILISSEVLKNTTAAGGQITLLDTAKLDGNLTAAGGNIIVNTPIAKEFNAAGGQINLDSLVSGDVNVATDELILGPKAKVDGNLVYWSNNKLSLSPQATVSGQISQNIPPKKINSEDVSRNIGSRISNFFSFLKIVNLISAILVGLILLKLFPVFSKQTADRIIAKPLQNLLIGAVVAIFTPVLAVILAITIIGLPIALIIFAGFFVLIYIVKIYVSLMIGQKIVDLINQKASIYWIFILGILVYSLLTLIPILGGLIVMILGLMGLGALVLEKKSYYQSLSSKKLI